MKKMIRVAGMSCGHCKQAVEGAANAIAGAASAEASVENGTLTVEYGGGPEVARQIKNAVEEQGFDVVE